MSKKKTLIFNGEKYAEDKIFSIGVDVKKVYETNEFIKLCEILSKLKNKS